MITSRLRHVLLQRLADQIGLNRADVPRGNRRLGARRLRAQLEVRVTQRLADRVDADERTRRQEVLALDIARARRVHLRPLGVGVRRQQIHRVQLLTRVAALGLVRRRANRGIIRERLLLRIRRLRDSVLALLGDRARRVHRVTAHGATRCHLRNHRDHLMVCELLHADTGQKPLQLRRIRVYREGNNGQDNQSNKKVLIKHCF